MNLKSFKGPGSTPSRRRFWDQVTQAVIASQKVAGRHVTVDEHQGMGTVINVDDSSGRRGSPAPIGACCYNDGTCDDLTEADCNDAGGHWQGSGTTCEGTDCTGGGIGACCIGDMCTITVAVECAGTFHPAITCDPNPCEGPATARCCLPDQSCEDLTEDDCTTAGGTFIPGTTCDDSACTCCIIIGAFQPCDDGLGNCTLEQACGGDVPCLGDPVDCDSRYLTDIEYCCTEGGERGRTCCTSSWNPITCEFVQTGPCDGEGGCGCTEPGEGNGASHEVADEYIPCV